ncbi:hypothetical protein GN958_ATG02591 [Phytophthora infestans]|uniref:Uncharacterized protein n=1 Tax=Phytophthora infestans TaxID=4787 RepID=A0A8S9V7Z8_PHYIN|nr:hypothetical protein GN958_ATG02591 [Phytophthora infestans]
MNFGRVAIRTGILLHVRKTNQSRRIVIAASASGSMYTFGTLTPYALPVPVTMNDTLKKVSASFGLHETS